MPMHLLSTTNEQRLTQLRSLRPAAQMLPRKLAAIAGAQQQQQQQQRPQPPTQVGRCLAATATFLISQGVAVVSIIIAAAA